MTTTRMPTATTTPRSGGGGGGRRPPSFRTPSREMPRTRRNPRGRTGVGVGGAAPSGKRRPRVERATRRTTAAALVALTIVAVDAIPTAAAAEAAGAVNDDWATGAGAENADRDDLFVDTTGHSIGDHSRKDQADDSTSSATTADAGAPKMAAAQAQAQAQIDNEYDNDVVFESAVDRRIVVTDQAMGARCAVAADFDGDGRMDLVSASSNDNAVSWFRNEGPSDSSGEGSRNGPPSFSIKRKITWSSLGSRIVTVADVDSDGDVDVVGASYYDSSLRWYENDGAGQFTSHDISTAVNEGQGVTVADLDNDSDPDIATASSGDNTIAVFKNIDRGVFCEIKEVVDDDAVGARTVVASDLNGDGWIDLASASKDDDTVAWYPNDGTGHFPTKLVVSRGYESQGAYSLVAADVDSDGDSDLIVASNGNDHVSLWRNDGNGNFTKTLIYDSADFVLSVTAVDFDRDGDIDVASASFFDGHVNWYENVDGSGYEWKNHTIYVGVQGHYVSTGDLDGDGDDDLIAVTHAENTVAVFLARTECDPQSTDTAEEAMERARGCCRTGTEWNGTACEPCSLGTYGIGSGVDAQCIACPTDACIIAGLNALPATCSGYTGCANATKALGMCSCPTDTMKDPSTDTCAACPAGQVRPDPDSLTRGNDTLGNYTAWELQQGVCALPTQAEDPNHITTTVRAVGLSLACVALFLSALFAAWTYRYRGTRIVRASQPFFLGMICFGTAVMSLAILPFGVDDGAASKETCNYACMAGPWLICTGFTVAFSAVFSKIWRINQVFNSNLRKIKVTERDVLRPFGVLFAINVAVLTAWTVLDPLVWTRQPIKDGQEWETYGSCRAQGVVSIASMSILAFTALVALGLACVQAYHARTISDEFSESKYVGIAMVCWLQVLLVGLPLLFLVGDTNPSASYFLKSALVFVVSASLLLLVFVPKAVQKNRTPARRRGGNVRISMASGASECDTRRFSDDFTGGGGGSLGGGSGHGIGGGGSNNPISLSRMSMGEGGMHIVSPQLEVMDLKGQLRDLRTEMRRLRSRNEELEEMHRTDGGSKRKSSVAFQDDTETEQTSDAEDTGTTSPLSALKRKSVQFEDMHDKDVSSSDDDDDEGESSSSSVEQGGADADANDDRTDEEAGKVDSIL